VSPALKTTYDYGPGGRVTTITPAGELPWQLHYANPDVDSAALRWDLDETAGTNAPDTSGNSRNGSTTNTSWVRGPSRDPVDRAASFNGTDSVITRTAGSGVATNTSFTVSAWVNLADGAGHHTAVAQDGTVVSGFFLEESGGYWALSRPASDVWDTPIRAWSSAPAEYGTWTHLTGVYDGTAGQIKLYVNGVLNETTACACAWNATGPFVVGRVKWNSAYGDWWRGDIDDVRIYNKVLTAEQIADLAGDKSPGKLIKVERAALQQGSPTVQDGTIATNLVYNVPLTTTSGGPHTLDAATAATWSQTDLPTDATALFGPRPQLGHPHQPRHRRLPLRHHPLPQRQRPRGQHRHPRRPHRHR
jgi:hypothetical protein